MSLVAAVTVVECSYYLLILVLPTWVPLPLLNTHEHLPILFGMAVCHVWFMFLYLRDGQ
jgi:hypothetical protein